MTPDLAPVPAGRIIFPNEDEWAAGVGLFNPPPRELVLSLAVNLSHRVPGNIIEFGVARGGSTRTIRRVLRQCERSQILGPRKKLFACDSFEGLTEQFENAPPGTFACDPPKIRGVEIVKGYFESSLTQELANRVGRVALASLDADLYSSTLCALRWLTPLLATGSLLIFDEYLGENASERHAHEDWRQETRVQTVLVAEFLREPSGWGATPDRRSLFQVLGDEPLSQTKIVSIGGVKARARSLARRALVGH